MSLVLALLMALSLAQEEGDEKYKLKIREDAASPTGIYITKDLDDALAALKRMLHPSLIADLRERRSDPIEFHHGLGTWVRNNWGLWKRERLWKYFADKGIGHPDDISGIILQCLTRDLRGEPIDLAGQVTAHRKRQAWSAYNDMYGCPWDDSVVPVRAYFPSETRDGLPARIFVGRCKEHGHLWAAESEKGVFRPGGRLLDEVRKAEARAKKPWHVPLKKAPR